MVAQLDLSAFHEPIKAREGVAGRDATDPELLVSFWLYACIRGIGSARELARRCEERAPFRWRRGGVGVKVAGGKPEARRGAATQRRLEQALAQLPELKQRQQEGAKRAGQGKYGNGERTKPAHRGIQGLA